MLFVIVAILMVTVVLRDSRPAGVPTTRAPLAIATTNRYRRFEADDADGLREFLSDRVAKWWIPEQVEFIDEVPKTSVGKFSKKTLRERFS